MLKKKDYNEEKEAPARERAAFQLRRSENDLITLSVWLSKKFLRKNKQLRAMEDCGRAVDGTDRQT